MRYGEVGLCWLLTACAGSDLCRRIESDEVSIAYVQITRASTASCSFRPVDGEHSGYGGFSVFDGTIAGVLVRSGELVAMRPEDVIDRYVSKEDSRRLEEGWSESNGETVCRLYEGDDGRKHLLLCQLYASATYASSANAPSPGARAVEKRADVLRVGVRCVEHHEWVLFFLFPCELETCAPHVLTRVMATMERKHLRCPFGSHAVAAPDTE